MSESEEEKQFTPVSESDNDEESEDNIGEDEVRNSTGDDAERKTS